MTARATFTQAELARAIRAAEACGKVAVLTPAGIVFADPAGVALPSLDESAAEVAECDKAFGASSAGFGSSRRSRHRPKIEVFLMRKRRQSSSVVMDRTPGLVVCSLRA